MTIGVTVGSAVGADKRPDPRKLAAPSLPDIRDDPGRGTSDESWLRHRPPKLGDVDVVHEPDPGPEGFSNQLEAFARKPWGCRA